MNPADILTKILGSDVHMRIAALLGITLVWADSTRSSSSTNVQAISRFLQLVTLATCAHESDAYDEGVSSHGYFLMDLMMYMMSTIVTILVAAMILRRFGHIEVGVKLAQPETTRDNYTQTVERHTLELHDVTVDGLRKIGASVGLGSSTARAMTKDELTRTIRANPEFKEVVY